LPVKLLKEWNVEEVDAAVALSRDGTIALVVSGMKNGIDCVEVPNGAKTQSLQGHTATVTALAIAPDCRYGASGDENGEVRLWELSTGKPVGVLHGHSKRIASLAYSPNGRILLSGSWDNTSRSWDVQTIKSVSTFQGHSAGVTGVAISPDGKTAATSSFDCCVRIWEMATGKCQRQLPSQQSKLICVSISGNGKRLIAGDAKGCLGVSDWPATHAKIVGPLPAAVGSVRLSNDGTKAYLGLSGGGFWSYDLKTQNAKQLFELTGRFPAQLPFGLDFAMSEDARYVVATRAASAAIIELERPGSRFSWFGRRSS